jgi:biopolymer transport protein ExbB
MAGLMGVLAAAMPGLMVQAQQPGSPPAAPSAATAPEARGFLEIVFAGGVPGIAIMIVLLALSVLTAWLIIDHLISARRADLMPPGLAEQTRQLLANGQVEQARELCNRQPGVMSFVLLHGMAEMEFGWTAVEKAVEDALAEQSARLYRKIEYLAVIGNMAPMVGLLGTVVGMILAFQQVAVSQATAGAPQLAEGIYQALVTTVVGLIVAIPAIGAFAVFRNRIDQLVAETGYTVQHVFGPLRRRKK